MTVDITDVRAFVRAITDEDLADRARRLILADAWRDGYGSADSAARAIIEAITQECDEEGDE